MGGLGARKEDERGKAGERRSRCTGLRIQRSIVDVVHYVGDTLDGTIPSQKVNLNSNLYVSWASSSTKLWRGTNILKLPPTKNCRAMFAIEVRQGASR